MMCPCACHMDNYDGCTDCIHMHSAEEIVMMQSKPSDEPTTTETPTTEEPAVTEHVCAVATCGGTKDGLGSGDHDVWYVRPVLTWQQEIRAMIVRSRLGDNSDRKALRDRGREAA